MFRDDLRTSSQRPVRNNGWLYQAQATVCVWDTYCVLVTNEDGVYKHMVMLYLKPLNRSVFCLRNRWSHCNRPVVGIITCSFVDGWESSFTTYETREFRDEQKSRFTVSGVSERSLSGCWSLRDMEAKVCI